MIITIVWVIVVALAGLSYMFVRTVKSGGEVEAGKSTPALTPGGVAQAKAITKYATIKEILDNCLPNTPVECMWQVEKIKREHFLLLRYERQSKVPDSVAMNRHSEVIWDDHPQFEELKSEAYGPIQVKYLAKITLIGSAGPFKSVEIALVEGEEFLASFQKHLIEKTQAIVAEYGKDTSDWDGIYIKSQS